MVFMIPVFAATRLANTSYSVSTEIKCVLFWLTLFCSHRVGFTVAFFNLFNHLAVLVSASLFALRRTGKPISVTNQLEHV